MKKRAFAILCAAAIILSAVPLSAFAASAPAASSTVATNIPKTFPVVKQDPSYTLINFWSSMTGANGVAVDNIVNWFNATIGKQKKIYVKGVFQGAYADIAMKVQASVQSKNVKVMPDLALLAPQGAFALKESPYLVYMQDMINADKTFTIKDKLNPNALNACSYKGRQMGMPFANSALVMFYNADAFKAAGLDPDKPPKTFAELADVAKKLAVKGTGSKLKRYGVTYKLDATNLATWITRMNGGKGTSFQYDQEDGRLGTPTKLVCAENGTLKNVLTEWKKVTDTGAVDYKTSSGTANFEAGMTTIYFNSSTSYNSISDYFKAMSNKSKVFEHRVARLPQVNEKDGVASHVGGSAMYMFEKNDAAKKKATWEFVKFLASVDVAAYWSVDSGYFALNNDATKTKYMQDYWKQYPNSKVLYDIRSESSMNVKAQAPMIPNSDAYVNSVSDQVCLYAEGKQTVDATVSAIAKKANGLLDTWWRANKK